LKHLNHILVDGNSMRSIRRSIVSLGCESIKKYLRTRGKPPSGVDVLEEETDEFTEIKSDGEFSFIFRDASASGHLDISGKRLVCFSIL